METYRKSDTVQTKERAEQLMDDMDAFIKRPEVGAAPPRLPAALLKIWNNGERLKWKWSGEGKQEYDQRMAKKKAETAELKRLKGDIEYFKDIKIRPWRNGKLSEWIDDTFRMPLKYGLAVGEETERQILYTELCDWPGLFTEYKTDEEIEALKIAPPSWISG